ERTVHYVRRSTARPHEPGCRLRRAAGFLQTTRGAVAGDLSPVWRASMSDDRLPFRVGDDTCFDRVPVAVRPDEFPPGKCPFGPPESDIAALDRDLRTDLEIWWLTVTGAVGMLGILRGQMRVCLRPGSSRPLIWPGEPAGFYTQCADRMRYCAQSARALAR